MSTPLGELKTVGAQLEVTGSSLVNIDSGIESARIAMGMCAKAVQSAIAALQRAESPVEGKLGFALRCNQASNAFTNTPTPTQLAWMAASVDRFETFTPYADSRAYLRERGWVYLDSYSIAVQGATAAQLALTFKDASGNPLYIPWGSKPWPQYAADFTNPLWREQWIANARIALANGYKGLWIDDVNMDPKISTAESEMTVLPTVKGQTLTVEQWREALASFMVQIRIAFPDAEIVHNCPWYAGGYRPGEVRDLNPQVERQLKQCDFINREGGANDSGLKGGTGEWSLEALLQFSERAHALPNAPGVIWDDFGATEAEWLYNQACALLVSNGNDMVGEQHTSPSNWSPIFGQNLGRALGARTQIGSLLMRHFETASVYVLPPETPELSFTGADGKPYALKAKSGLIIPMVSA